MNAFKKQALALHPDTNGGRSPNPLALMRLFAQRKADRLKYQIHVSAGYRIKAQGHWWSVVRRQSGGWFYCKRKLFQLGGGGEINGASIHRREMTDVRCGPGFVYRMVHIANPDQCYVECNGVNVREAEVLNLLSEGQKTSQVSEQLGMAKGTVHIHVHNAGKRMGIKGRMNIVEMWKKNNPSK